MCTTRMLIPDLPKTKSHYLNNLNNMYLSYSSLAVQHITMSLPMRQVMHLKL